MAQLDLLSALTVRELEVLDLLRLGLTDAEVAKRLNISLSGAKYHAATIMRKLDVRDRYEAAYFPDSCPWWVRGLAPLFWLRPGKAALSIKASVVAVAATATGLVAAVGGLGALAVLLFLSSQNERPAGSTQAPTPTTIQRPSETALPVQPTAQGPQSPQVPVVVAAAPQAQVPIAPPPNADEPPNPQPEPPTPQPPPPAQLRALLVTGSNTCFFTAESEVRCAGGQFGTTPVETGPAGVLGLVSVGGEHTCAKLQTGNVQCWGSNTYGQLGNGGDAYHRDPEDVVGLLGDPVQLSAGGDRTCAVLSNGGIQCWGSNDTGQLGAPSTEICMSFFVCSTRPVNVCADSQCNSLLLNAVSVALGQHHTCAIVGADGQGRCWGNGAYGELGSGRAARDNDPGASVVEGRPYYPPGGVPAVVCADAACATPLTGVAAFVAGDNHTCALVSGPSGNGVKCWGRNNHGQLGNGGALDTSTPVDVEGLSRGVQALSAGGSHTCALTTQGEVKCWGENTSGQLGDGTTIDRGTPVLVEALGRGVGVVAAGAQHTCAIDASEEVSCWGSNYNGQLSNGTLQDHLLPAAVTWSPLPPAPGPAFAIDCDAARTGAQERCSFALGDTFTVHIHVLRAPDRGYAAFQAVTDWTPGVIEYLPLGSPEDLLHAVDTKLPVKQAPEALWTGCAFGARAFNAVEAWIAYGCSRGPAEELRYDTGPVLQFQFRCLQRGLARMALRPMAGEGDGTLFIGPVQRPGMPIREDFIAAELLSADITCA